jgi:hypothetical protein
LKKTPKICAVETCGYVDNYMTSSVLLKAIPLELHDPAWERACHIYLRFIFNGAPPRAIKCAADVVLRYSPLFGRPDDRVLH